MHVTLHYCIIPNSDSVVVSPSRPRVSPDEIHTRIFLLAAPNIAAKRFAYVWYYSMPTYACSAMVAMRRLQALRRRKSNSSARAPLNVSYVLVYSESGKRNVSVPEIIAVTGDTSKGGEGRNALTK